METRNDLMQAVERNLEIWAAWHRRESVGSDLGFLKRTIGLSTGSSEFDSMADAADARLAIATDAAILSLSGLQRQALNVSYGIAKHWASDTAALIEETMSAKFALLPILRRKCALYGIL